ncbi:hypothetical protein TNCV_998491 [Trichonephila clavipes]|nr:hypothetical protein TNCV_998491 [Trichonephila clavipes]
MDRQKEYLKINFLRHQALTILPILTCLHSRTKPFIADRDASVEVSWQYYQGNRWPEEIESISLLGEVFIEPENCSNHSKEELQTLLKAIRHLHHYLVSKFPSDQHLFAGSIIFTGNTEGGGGRWIQLDSTIITLTSGVYGSLPAISQSWQDISAYSPTTKQYWALWRFSISGIVFPYPKNSGIRGWKTFKLKRLLLPLRSQHAQEIIKRCMAAPTGGHSGVMACKVRAEIKHHKNKSEADVEQWCKLTSVTCSSSEGAKDT